jgi:hypothetical protein
MDTGSFLNAATVNEAGTSMVSGTDAVFAKEMGMSYEQLGALNQQMGTEMTTKAIGEKATSGLLSKMSDDVAGGLVEGAFGIGGQLLAGMGEEKKWQAEMDAQIAEAEKQRLLEMMMLKANLAAKSSGGGGSAGSDRDWAAELAENRRQFNEELGQRKAEFASTMDMRKQELYAPMEYQTEARKRAGSALASVGVKRGQYKEAPTVKEQLQNANAYPEPIKPEEQVA